MQDLNFIYETTEAIENMISSVMKDLDDIEKAKKVVGAVESGRTYDYGCLTYTDDFIGAMAKALDAYGELTEKQLKAILNKIDK